MNWVKGDTITWTDPDEGICTKIGVIQTIEWLEWDVVKIVFDDDSVLEASTNELT